MTLRFKLLLVLAVVPLYFSVPAHAEFLRTVALKGQQAPGAPAGTNFRFFAEPPTLNSAGQTAFRGFLQTGINSEGIWSEGAGTLNLIARAGTQAPGTPSGANFGGFSSPALNSSGQIAFQGSLRGGAGGVSSSNNQGIWSEGSGSLNLVARTGFQAIPDTVFSELFFTPVLNSVGKTSFRGHLETDGAVVTGDNDRGIWSEGVGTLDLVAREGSQAPGTPSGAIFSGFSTFHVLNSMGQTAFAGFLEFGEGGVTADNFRGIWSGGSGALALVARSGSQAPGAPNGANFSSFSAFPVPVLNGTGQTAFKGFLQTGVSGVSSGNDSGIWSEGNGTLALAAREGSQAPGTPSGATFDDFSEFFAGPSLNSAGKIAFQASLRLGGGGVDFSNDDGIWSEGKGTLNLVAREGSQAPGTPNGTSFGNELLGGLQIFAAPVLNSGGQTAFLARLRIGGGFVTSSNDEGIWAEDSNGVLTLIVREGDRLDVNDGPGIDFRTVSSLDFIGDSGNEDGRRSGFNDLGQVAFGASFTDGTEGIFVSNLVANLGTLPGDFNSDGTVDAADYTVWLDNFGNSTGLANDNNLGTVAQLHYDLWKSNFGMSVGSGSASDVVPEPSTFALATLVLLGMCSQLRRLI